VKQSIISNNRKEVMMRGRIVFILTMVALLFSLSVGSTQADPPGGELVIVLSSMDREIIIPSLNGNVTEHQVWNPLVDFLVYIDTKTGEPIPGLAKSWSISEDYKTYTFKIREGVKFAEGWGEFTSADAKFSIENARQSKTAGQYWEETIKDIDASDPYTLVLHLKVPRWDLLLSRFPNMPCFVPMLCKKYVESVGLKEANRHPIGTGPYKLHERRVGDFIKFEYRPIEHWRVKNPGFKYITAKVVPDEATRVAMLRSREADIIPISMDSVPMIEKEKGLRILEVPNAQMYWIVLADQALPENENFAPVLPWEADYRDAKSWERAKKVRKALNLAVNRKEIADTIFRGLAQPVYVPYFFPGQPWTDPSWKIPYDPERARQLLAEAGYPKGFEMTMYLVKHSGRPENAAVGEVVASYWEQNLGLKVNRRPIDFSTFKPMMGARKVNAAWTYGLGPIGAELSFPLGNCGPSYARYNIWLDHPWFDKAIEDVLVTCDTEKRHKLEKEIGQFFYDNSVSVALVSKSGLYGVSQKVGKWPVIPGSQWMGMNWASITFSGQ
jgi:peptide/nickel transport system substrate-binding protein